jgi:YegS/Rv2252/BmrU family lipid kinase
VSQNAQDLVVEARRAVRDGVERLLVAGGDGTFHHVAQGLVASDCALGVIPLGRGNDFAGVLAVPSDLKEAFQWAQKGTIRKIDVGRVNDRYFTGYCGVGFDSEAAQYADEAPAIFSGPLAYVYSVLRTLFSFRPPVMTVQHGDGEFHGRAMFAVACNISRFGGGMRIAPAALFDDGALDLVIAKELGKIEILRVFPKVYTGEHVSHPAVEITRTPTATVEVDRALTIACDGELVGRLEGGKLQVSIEAGALKVVAAASR